MMKGASGAIALLPSLGPWFGAATLVALLLKAWQPFRKMAIDQNERHNARLLTRIEKLEGDLKDQTEKLENRLHEERVQHEAVLQVMRHRLNNMTMCLDALLMLLETAPERVQQSVFKIKEMRARQEAMESTEKMAVTTAMLMPATNAAHAPRTDPPAG